MKTNLGKCHLLLNTNQNKLVNVNSNAIHNAIHLTNYWNHHWHILQL